MALVLSCVPVQYEVVSGEHPVVVTAEHQLGECDDCGVDIWISGEHMELYEFHPEGYLLYCRLCARADAFVKGRRRP